MDKVRVLRNLDDEDRKLLKWDEARHPRGEDGKFGSGGGEGTGYAAQRGYGGHGEAPKAERKERAKADAAEERARANYPVKAGGENKEPAKPAKESKGEAKNAAEHIKNQDMYLGDSFIDQNGKKRYFTGFHGDLILNTSKRPTSKDFEYPNLDGAVHFSDVKATGKHESSYDEDDWKEDESFEPEIVGYEDGKPVYGGAKLEARVAARQKEWEEAGRPDERLQEEKTKHSKGLAANGFELEQWHKQGDADAYHFTMLDKYGNEKKSFVSRNKQGGYDADTIGSGLIGPKKTSHATLEEARAAGLKRLKDAPDMEPYPEGKAETHEHWVNRVKEAKKIDLPDFMPGYFEGRNEAK